MPLQFLAMTYRGATILVSSKLRLSRWSLALLSLNQHSCCHPEAPATIPPPPPFPNLCKHSVMDEVDLEAICLQGRFPLGETVDPCDWEMTVRFEMALPWSLARRPDAWPLPSGQFELRSLCCFELQPSPRIRPKLFRICQKTIRLGGKFRRCKNYQNGFFKTFFFCNKRTNQP